MQHRNLRDLAYQLWQDRGCPDGSPEEDWLAAERLLSAAQPPSHAASASNDVDDSLKGSFPASDPSASHLPDEPPANAEAKWEAAGKPRKESRRRPNSTPAAAQIPRPQDPRQQGR